MLCEYSLSFYREPSSPTKPAAGGITGLAFLWRSVHGGTASLNPILRIFSNRFPPSSINPASGFSPSVEENKSFREIGHGVSSKPCFRGRRRCPLPSPRRTRSVQGRRMGQATAPDPPRRREVLPWEDHQAGCSDQVFREADLAGASWEEGEWRRIRRRLHPYLRAEDGEFPWSHCSAFDLREPVAYRPGQSRGRVLRSPRAPIPSLLRHLRPVPLQRRVVREAAVHEQARVLVGAHREEGGGGAGVRHGS